MMCSVLLMPPISDGANFSIIIMEQDGMCRCAATA
jgi:hypothetical protein